MTNELWRWNATELAQAIRTRRISSREATQACLDRVEAVNGKLNAIVVPLAEQALKEADAADAAVKSGQPLGPLHGVPVTIKENIDQAGLPTVNGVEAFKNVIAKNDSPPVANWRKAGAVIIGRTNTPAFSLRWHTDNAARGRTYNPWAQDRTPGGSSGGAGAAVASGCGPLAHGNDYGGSIRYPAYCCGVAGIRPTLGRVPAYNPSATEDRPISAQLMSVQGPLARRIEDVRLGLAAMAGRDPRDPWWMPVPLDLPAPTRPIKVALCVDPAGQGVAPEVADAIRQAGQALSAAGYAVEEAEPPAVGAAAELWGRIVAADTRQMMLGAIQQYADEPAKRAIGNLLSGYPEISLLDYMRALAERARMMREWSLFLEQYPLIVGPVSAELPFAVGFDTGEADTMLTAMKAQRLLVTVNLLGLPAVSVPTGVARGVPVGVQVIGGRYREMLCLDAAEVIEAQHPLPTPIDPKW